MRQSEYGSVWTLKESDCRVSFTAVGRCGLILSRKKELGTQNQDGQLARYLLKAECFCACLAILGPDIID